LVLNIDALLLDTESDAEVVQLEIYRRMTPARRVAIGHPGSVSAP
jgi:hypothetical protein